MKLLEMYAEGLVDGYPHLVFSNASFASPDEAAVHFNLIPIGECWRLLDRGTANLILCWLLWKDMAYRSERMPETIAKAEAAEFLSRFSTDARFYTNGTWDKEALAYGSGERFGPSWRGATESTFDGGILALDTASSGVLWFEDED